MAWLDPEMAAWLRKVKPLLKPRVDPEIKVLADSLYCPQCSKPVPQHSQTQAYECLYLLAEKEGRKLYESLTKEVSC